MACLSFVRRVFASFKRDSGLEPKIFDALRISAAQPGKVVYELNVEKHHTNRLGTVHGGTIASLVDLGGSLAVASKGLHATGVTTDLNATFLSSGGRVGDILRGETVCDKFGRNLAYTTTSFYDSHGKIVARGSHTKYVAQAWKDPENCVGNFEEK